MDSPSSIILTPFNYHEWKAKIGILLRSRGLYRVTIALENEPNAGIKKVKWHNRLDEAYGLFFLSISPYLLFHLDGVWPLQTKYGPNLSLSLEYKMR